MPVMACAADRTVSLREAGAGHLACKRTVLCAAAIDAHVENKPGKGYVLPACSDPGKAIRQ